MKKLITLLLLVAASPAIHAASLSGTGAQASAELTFGTKGGVSNTLREGEDAHSNYLTNGDRIAVGTITSLSGLPSKFEVDVVDAFLQQGLVQIQGRTRKKFWTFGRKTRGLLQFTVDTVHSYDGDISLAVNDTGIVLNPETPSVSATYYINAVSSDGSDSGAQRPEPDNYVIKTVAYEWSE